MLSICIFIGFSDSPVALFPAAKPVVNCFQFVFLSGSLTAIGFNFHGAGLLWIAFNLYFYRVLWQHFVQFPVMEGCCELLSICIFIGFSDSKQLEKGALEIVVNCFQFVFLSGSLTANWLKHQKGYRLWIAFNLYFYRVLWQPPLSRVSRINCCELLSICIFIGFSDSILVPS